MSQHVDMDKPLTDADRAYLASRGRYADIERIDNLHGVETPAPDAGDGTGPVSHGTASYDVRDQRIADLERELALLKGGDSDVVEDEEELPPYEDWTVPALDKELKDRKLSTDGKKDDKVERLYADDEARGMSAV